MTKIQTQGVHHITFVGSNREAIIDFYQGVLGMPHIGELSLRLGLLPGEVYIWDRATFPALRRNRLYSALLGYMIKELHAEGFCRAWIGADMDNLPCFVH